MKILNTLLVLATTTGLSHAATTIVSVNLASGQRVVNKTAGVEADTTWANINDGAAGSASNVDSSTIDVSWVTHSNWHTNAANVTGGDQLMYGRWDTGVTGDVITIADINDTLPAYDLIVYYSYNQGNKFDLTVDGVTRTINQGGQAATADASNIGINNYLTAGWENGTDPSLWVRFTGLTADSVSLNVANIYVGQAGIHWLPACPAGA